MIMVSYLNKNDIPSYLVFSSYFVETQSMPAWRQDKFLLNYTKFCWSESSSQYLEFLSLFSLWHLKYHRHILY